ncbi:DEAD/DEAH box helicase [Methylocystis heyeri]|uniref:DEAD/DEAH box helicase n=1 Tax=Methylocystis heyeri TaxID=391905 RepID=A0A6B8KGI6_9HYPH|nr:DEAD/DEAH box helicase [Methylocystis heyeri]QGM47484.1 DEAD/DEAH box helicase [Methylocystis heyeri]
MTFPHASPPLARALSERNYNDLTPIQSAVLAPEARSRDILASAQTGSGKTVAFGLAMAPELLGDAQSLPQAGAPLALVIAPTRELALQVRRELEWLYSYAGARIIACVGGMNPHLERRQLAEGGHIVVGTPGRLRDHIERGGLNAASLKVVALDEADEMLDMGFREDLEFILDAAPVERRTLLFSATMPKAIAALAKRYQRDPLRVEVERSDRGHADIEYRAVRVGPKEIELAVVNLLRFFETPTAIVFCNTRESVRHLHATLIERGFSAALLSGELSQHERNQSMQALRDGRARVCVATDVAARGIDLPQLGLVIHAELPTDAETLQHRSGRTGRAGRKGVSALLTPPSRRRRLEMLLREAGVRAIWSGPPTADEIRKLDQERLFKDPLLAETPTEQELELGRLLLADATPERLAAALIRLYYSRLPAVEEVADPGEEPLRSREPSAGRPAAATRFPQGSVWFRLDIGRKRNADPKWLLPMLCRKGSIRKQDVGAIRIFDHETQFEVAQDAAELFSANIRRPGGEPVKIERLAEHGKPDHAKRIRPQRDKHRAPTGSKD